MLTSLPMTLTSGSFLPHARPFPRQRTRRSGEFMLEQRQLGPASYTDSEQRLLACPSPREAEGWVVWWAVPARYQSRDLPITSLVLHGVSDPELYIWSWWCEGRCKCGNNGFDDGERKCGKLKRSCSSTKKVGRRESNEEAEVLQRKVQYGGETTKIASTKHDFKLRYYHTTFSRRDGGIFSSALGPDLWPTFQLWSLGFLRHSSYSLCYLGRWGRGGRLWLAPCLIWPIFVLYTEQHFIRLRLLIY